jgi:hypothetical protein
MHRILFTYLTNSLTPEFEREIKAQPARYTIPASGGTYRSGLLFLKVILSRSQTDTMATVEVLQRKVQSLSSKIVEMQGNIVEFHTYIKGLQNDFAAYNVTCDDLPINLFWAYQEVDDEQFRTPFRTSA